MSVEFTITVQDNKKVRAKKEDGAERQGNVQFDKLHHETIGIFEDWLNQGKISKRHELEVLGTHLYNVLFNGEVGAFFERALSEVSINERLRVQLSFQEEAYELASLPWEYLYFPDSATRAGFFMSTNVDLVLSRFMPLEDGRQSLQPVESPMRILIVVSKPEDLAPVLAETVIEVIKNLSNTKVDILEDSTIENFLDILKKSNPHVLHFIGHGRFNRADKKGEIALLNTGKKAEWVHDQSFAEYFTHMKVFPRLVFLHLCEGATIDFTANFAGLAPHLIRAKIQAVVAMQYPITNRAAISFSRAFYREIIKGEPVDNAVQNARFWITVEDPKAYECRVFGTPVLYMHSRDGIIQPSQDLGVITSDQKVDRTNTVGGQSDIKRKMTHDQITEIKESAYNEAQMKGILWSNVNQMIEQINFDENAEKIQQNLIQRIKDNPTDRMVPVFSAMLDAIKKYI